MKNYMGEQAAAVPAAPATTLPSVSGDEQGYNPKPTRGALADRSASPGGYNTSGIERAMGAAADKLHPVGKR